ncbi:hypothetical protein [Shewanella sp.]|uniref:hypothetical protein n=1 Tax=Shewanella sp. TaxID=50422 RepID=UPI003D11BF55
MYIERHSVPFTTYGAADVVKAKIGEAIGIKSIIFGARNAELNNFATTILLVADEGSYLFDTTNITMERPPRQLEVLSIFDVINAVGALKKAVYIPARIPRTDHLSAIEAGHLLNTFAVEKVFPNWRGFASIYNEKFEMYPLDCYNYSTRWNELSSNL